MTADRYLALGWNPIPLRKDKRPWIAWAPYQERRVTPEELEEWRRRHPGANVGIVTGGISGIVVLDVDGPAGAEELKKRHLPPTPTATTGKGTHYYFRHPGGVVRTMIRRLPELDLKGDGGYVMAPPSVHPSGGGLWYANSAERGCRVHPLRRVGGATPALFRSRTLSRLAFFQEAPNRFLDEAPQRSILQRRANLQPTIELLVQFDEQVSGVVGHGADTSSHL